MTHYLSGPVYFWLYSLMIIVSTDSCGWATWAHNLQAWGLRTLPLSIALDQGDRPGLSGAAWNLFVVCMSKTLSQNCSCHYCCSYTAATRLPPTTNIPRCFLNADSAWCDVCLIATWRAVLAMLRPRPCISSLACHDVWLGSLAREHNIGIM